MQATNVAAAGSTRRRPAPPPLRRRSSAQADACPLRSPGFSRRRHRNAHAGQCVVQNDATHPMGAWRLQRRPWRGLRGPGCPLGVPENLLFALFADEVGKKERKRGLGRSPKDSATTMPMGVFSLRPAHQYATLAHTHHQRRWKPCIAPHASLTLYEQSCDACEV